MRLKLGGAGVHHLVHRAQAPPHPQRANLLRRAVGQLADFGVRKAQPLGAPQQAGVQVGREQFRLHQRDVLEGAGEPWVNAGASRERLRADAAPQRVEQRPQPLVIRVQRQATPGRERGVSISIAVRRACVRFPCRVFPQNIAIGDFKRAHGFLHRRLKRAVNRHNLAGGFHLRVD